MWKYLFSFISFAIGIISWITKLILESPLVLTDNTLLTAILTAFAGFNLFSGLIVVIGIIFAIIGFIRNKSYALLILNTIVSCAYLITYVKMINLIMQQ